MEQIWAPWRIGYIRMEKPQGCFLCDLPNEDDDESNLILYRGEWNFIMMNNYPYNPGHLLVAPYRHIADLDKLPKRELHEHMDLIGKSVTVLKATFKPTGFNVGMNIGAVAGPARPTTSTRISYRAGRAIPILCRSSAAYGSSPKRWQIPISNSRADLKSKDCYSAGIKPSFPR